jgi:hypothetical protein
VLSGLLGLLVLFSISPHELLNDLHALDDDFFKNPLSRHQLGFRLVFVDGYKFVINRLVHYWLNAADSIFELGDCCVGVDALKMISYLLAGKVVAS